MINRRSVVSIEEIPAATQLFTPKWIVKYVVENSLGRLWMLNRPTSKIIGKMEYYIKPELEETDFLKIKSVEEIKICDPACGSGHMLVYAFELLYAIYEEEGFSASEIPSKILLNNLFGIEIDERAGELAAFALTMKAREKHRRYFSSIIQPKICVLENIHFEEREIKEYMDHVGHDLFSLPLQNTLRQFEEAKNFGSLIKPDMTDIEAVTTELEKKKVTEQLFLSFTHQKVLHTLNQADFLSRKYDVVIANPPYMGTKGMNVNLKAFLKENFQDFKSDLFSAFIARNLIFAKRGGVLGFVTPYVWMFIQSYEALRDKILKESTITSLIQLEYNAFAPACIPVCTFTLINDFSENANATFIKLSDFKGVENQPTKALEAIASKNCRWRFTTPLSCFVRISGAPLVYWFSKKIFEIYEKSPPLKNFSKGATGLQTSDSNRFIRFIHEVSINKIGKKWVKLAKGGTFRKWYGNVEHLVNWENSGEEIKKFITQKYPYLNGNYSLVVKNESEYFNEGLLTSRVTSGKLSFRHKNSDEVFSDACTAIFPEDNYFFLALLSSKLLDLVQDLNPTLNFQAGDIEKFPVVECLNNEEIKKKVLRCMEISRYDWDMRELSYGFKNNPLLFFKKNNRISDAYDHMKSNLDKLIFEIQKLEIENNKTLIRIYGLDAEIDSNVNVDDVSLICNPRYRYGGDKTEENLQRYFKTDVVKEFISYCIGCLFGRYSIEKEGLILANQGDTVKDYLNQIPNPTFAPDEDNVIPILEDDWFTDDITSLFKKFLKVTFGEEHFEENLKFIEDAIGKDIRKYFSKDFYNDHIKMYKKRPIYWMFSSPKGTFNALIYMHRYTPDTVSIVLNNYLREFRAKLLGKKENLERLSISGDASSRDKTSALKEIEQLKKMILELDEYEKDILYPLATQKIAIDLDDGVKVNYLKFGKALKPIKGLDKDEEG